MRIIIDISDTGKEVLITGAIEGKEQPKACREEKYDLQYINITGYKEDVVANNVRSVVHKLVEGKLIPFYPYSTRNARVTAKFRAGELTADQAYEEIMKIEKAAYEAMPDSEPDGDITYSASLALDEIRDIVEA